MLVILIVIVGVKKKMRSWQRRQRKKNNEGSAMAWSPWAEFQESKWVSRVTTFPEKEEKMLIDLESRTSEVADLVDE